MASGDNFETGYYKYINVGDMQMTMAAADQWICGNFGNISDNTIMPRVIWPCDACTWLHGMRRIHPPPYERTEATYRPCDNFHDIWACLSPKRHVGPVFLMATLGKTKSGECMGPAPLGGLFPGKLEQWLNNYWYRLYRFWRGGSREHRTAGNRYWWGWTDEKNSCDVTDIDGM